MEHTRIALQAYKYQPSRKRDIDRPRRWRETTILEAGTGEMKYNENIYSSSHFILNILFASRNYLSLLMFILRGSVRDEIIGGARHLH
jgi:hypothetical protein